MDCDLGHQQSQMNSGLMRFRSAPSSFLDSFMESIEPELPSNVVQQQNRFSNTPSSSSSMYYQTEQLMNRSSGGEARMGGSFAVVNPVGTDSREAKNRSNSSNLTRHSSSPAGVFAHLNVENGYPVMRDIGNAGVGSNSEAVLSSGLRNQSNFISRQSSSPGLLSRIAEEETDNIELSIPDNENLGYPMSSWDDLPLGDSLTSLKRVKGYDGNRGVSPSDQQIGEPRSTAAGLNHQFSFPKTAQEISAMEKFLEFQDSVPCKVRAKRGCATHPRSIAERVRRTRISERIRKLQELVPNMDKQTNTADMLDLAVEYIKDLQKQVKVLQDAQASCTCSSRQKQSANPQV